MNHKEIPEKPALMTAPMVKATLADIKTNTRRLTGLGSVNEFPDRFSFNNFHEIKGELFAIFIDKTNGDCHAKKCPYGKPGHRLWVRERHRYELSTEGEIIIEYFADKKINFMRDNEELNEIIDRIINKNRPSIFLHRFAARIILEITDIRIERLQDITAADCLAEGIDLPVPPNCEIQETPEGFDKWSKERQEDWFQSSARTTYMARCIDAEDHVKAFQALWESINGPGSWVLNPFVWCVEFKRVKS